MIWPAISRLLAILAIAGFLMTPMVTPSVAGVTMAVPTAAMEHMAAMPGGVNCCPEQHMPASKCPTDCPFASLCVAIGVPSLPMVGGYVVTRFGIPGALVLSNVSQRDQLGEEPPARPPRS